MFQMHCVPAMPGIERDRTLLHMKRIPCNRSPVRMVFIVSLYCQFVKLASAVDFCL